MKVNDPSELKDTFASQILIYKYCKRKKENKIKNMKTIQRLHISSMPLLIFLKKFSIKQIKNERRMDQMTSHIEFNNHTGHNLQFY